MLTPSTTFLAAAQLAGAAVLPRSSSSFGTASFKSLVSFGDSYTDDSRLSYFLNNNNTAPPVGYANPANYASASGGRPWPQYVAQYGGLAIHNYAVSGATCDSSLIPQQTINGNVFPDVKTYEVPAFFADANYTDPTTGKPFLDIPADQTAYSIWIGTNDVGYNGFLTGVQTPGSNLTTYLDCVYDQVQRLYDSGGRYFVIMTLAPLQLSPLYGFADAGGVGSDNYWKNKSNNTADIDSYALAMSEQVATVNSIYRYRTESETVAEDKYPGANFAVFNMEKLLTAINENPSQYLNGTAPLSVTLPDDKCDVNSNCVKNPSPDSFEWYDDLHPSEQTDRVIAREFLNVLGGNSSYATYFACK